MSHTARKYTVNALGKVPETVFISEKIISDQRDNIIHKELQMQSRELSVQINPCMH